MTQNRESPYQTYLKSDDWKCKNSPMGAHNWVENRTLSIADRVFQCVHCGEKKVLNNPIEKHR